MTGSMRRGIRRLLTAVVGITAVSLALSGCLYSMIPADAPVKTTAPDTAGVPAELMPYYSQELSWNACDPGFQCTEVTAPLDWADPAKGDIQLAIIMHRATSGTSQGALLFNPGGPGGSGYTFLRDSLSSVAGPALQRSYDIVGFDPRGVGRSTAVRCYDAPEMDAFLFDIVPGARDTDEWRRNTEAAQRGFAEACDENSDGILPYITTDNAARDLDLLRGVLGDRTLNYLGYSYGTFLGATYAGLFPDRVGRLVLDGALDPSISSLEVDTVQTIGFESALRAYMSWCLDQGSQCPFTGTVDDAMRDVATLFASVDRDPLRASDGRMLGADNLFMAVITPLYSRESWPALTGMFTEVLGGGADYAYYLVDFYYDRDEDGAYADNQTEAFWAYNCMDYPLVEDPAALAAAQQRLEEQAPTFAPYMTAPELCAQWVHPATGVREPITAEGAAPIVVVGTTNDPATPYEWSVALADQLSSGVLVTRVGEGHTGYNKGNACVDDAVESYFLDGTVPEDGLRCE